MTQWCAKLGCQKRKTWVQSSSPSDAYLPSLANLCVKRHFSSSFSARISTQKRVKSSYCVFRELPLAFFLPEPSLAGHVLTREAHQIGIAGAWNQVLAWRPPGTKMHRQAGREGLSRLERQVVHRVRRCSWETRPGLANNEAGGSPRWQQTTPSLIVVLHPPGAKASLLLA